MSTVPHESKRPADTLPLRLIALRHELGWSQREAAVVCGVPYGVWQGMESGRSTRDRDVWLGKIADVTGYDERWLTRGGHLSHPNPDGGGGSVITLRPEGRVQNLKLVKAA